ncbi:MAG: glycosyltransferase family 9 protein [Pyrinomonadaceae bacterium]
MADKPSDAGIDWTAVEKVLVVKLRSIGDTVLATPSLTALRRFLPHAQIDILLEDWVAPLLESFQGIDNVITAGTGSLSRFQVMRNLRREGYDVAFNLHGGTTSTFFTAASRARHRVGWAEYQYSRLYSHLYSSAADFWKKPKTHSAEQQLALLGFAGVPVEDRPASRLTVTPRMAEEIEALLHGYGVDKKRIALIHPAAAFATKQWSPQNFARVVEFIESKGLYPVAVTAPGEKSIIDDIANSTKSSFHGFSDLSLPQMIALASRSDLFVGNDSGIAHIAAAVETPSVVIFGSSNRDHWRPWAPTNDVPNEIVFEEFSCQPCPGYECKVFGEPRCILSVSTGKVFAAIEKLLAI